MNNTRYSCFQYAKQAVKAIHPDYPFISNTIGIFFDHNILQQFFSVAERKQASNNDPLEFSDSEWQMDCT